MNTEEFFRRGWTSKKITKTALTGLTVSVDATAKTLTRSAGSWIDDGIAVSDIITTTGFTAAGNNSSFDVISVTDTVLTVEDRSDTLVDVTDDGAVGVDPVTKAVAVRPCLLGRITVVTTDLNVTAIDGDNLLWDVTIWEPALKTADINFSFTPLKVHEALKAEFSIDGSAWLIFKLL